MLAWLAGLLLATSVHADTMGDYRANLNGWYASWLAGDCNSTPQDRSNCENCSTPAQPRTPAEEARVASLVNDVRAVGQSEEQFFARAAAAEVANLTCYQTQLRNMADRTSQDANDFQVQVMADIEAKLPDLRRYKRDMTACKGRLNDMAKRLEGVDRGVARSFHTPQQAEDLKRPIFADIEVEKRTCDPITTYYNMLFHSLWRSDDKHMATFLNRVIDSDQEPAGVYLSGLGVRSRDGLLEWALGATELSFKEEVLDRMLATAQEDLQSLRAQSVGGQGASFNGSQLNYTTRRNLLQNSQWADHLDLATDAGVRSAAVLMCQLDQRYLSGHEYVDNTAFAASMFTGGAGLFAKLGSVARIARVLNPTVASVAMRASYPLVMASSYLALPTAIQNVVNNCFQAAPQARYLAPGECSTETQTGFARLERERTFRDSCVIASVMTATNGLPVVFQVGRPLQRYLDRANQALQARTMSRVAADVARTEREARAITQLSRQDEIVVTAARGPTSAQRTIASASADVTNLCRRSPRGLSECVLAHVPDKAFRRTVANSLSRYTRDDRTVLNRLMRSVRNDVGERQLLEVILNNQPATLAPYLALLRSEQITIGELQAFLLHPELRNRFPDLVSGIENGTGALNLVRLLTRTDPGADTMAWAANNASRMQAQWPELSARMTAVGRTRQTQLNFTNGQEVPDQEVSLLWFPRYPSGSPSNTHTKIVVDGEVWGTMSTFERLRPLAVHERLAEKSLQHGFVEYRITTKPAEVERLRQILNTNDRNGLGLGMCVQGSCGALSRAGITSVPAPFNQVPSLAALYLSVARMLPGSGVSSVRFVTRNATSSLLSVDILVDGVAIGYVTMGISAPAYLGAAVYKELSHKDGAE